MLFSLLTNVKMPTIIGVLTFMSRKNFMLSCACSTFQLPPPPPSYEIFINSIPRTLRSHSFCKFSRAKNCHTTVPPNDCCGKRQGQKMSSISHPGPSVDAGAVFHFFLHLIHLINKRAACASNRVYLPCSKAYCRRTSACP